MPKRNGYEAYEAIARIDPHVKAIFISGYTNDFLQRQDIANRGLVLVSKPFSPTELIKHVRAAFQASPLDNNVRNKGTTRSGQRYA
jgi:DNA-binding NarL/FixJ family response regulator